MKRLGKKKAEKLERKEEKRKHREYLDAQREERKKHQTEEDEERQRVKAEERAREVEEDRVEKRRAEELAKEEEAEYQRLKRGIVVEESGVEELPGDEVEALLVRMARYVEAMKVVTVEELASELQLRTAEVAVRLKQLDQEGRIQGVLDDRGKYVYISKAEFEAVAQFVRRKGRVSKEELAAASNKLINLKPVKSQAQEKENLFGE